MKFLTITPSSVLQPCLLTQFSNAVSHSLMLFSDDCDISEFTQKKCGPLVYGKSTLCASGETKPASCYAMGRDYITVLVRTVFFTNM